MKKIIGMFFIAGAVLACNKDKFKTQPQINIESYNTKEVPPDGNLTIDLKFTDKEGDISGGTFVYIPKRTNARPAPPGTDYSDTAMTSTIPTFPNNTLGFIRFTLPWSYLHLSDIENDSVYFRFVAIDKAGHVSDTAVSDNIVILRQ